MIEYSVTIDGQTLPPLLEQPATIHLLRSEFPQFVGRPPKLREGGGYVKGCSASHTLPLSLQDAALAALVFTNPLTYGDRANGEGCFYPGFAFTFGSAKDEVHVQICIDCSWIVFHSSLGQQEFVPSAIGAKSLEALYERMLGHLLS